MTVVSKLAAAAVCVGAVAVLGAVSGHPRPDPPPAEPVLTAEHLRGALGAVHTAAGPPLAGAFGAPECALWDSLRGALSPAPAAAALPCAPSDAGAPELVGHPAAP